MVIPSLLQRSLSLVTFMLMMRFPLLTALMHRLVSCLSICHMPQANCYLKKRSNCRSTLDQAEKPLAAIVGGSKISTKLALLENLIQRVDVLIVGGAMAHTFLVAKGIDVGKSLYESKLVATAKQILEAAENSSCKLMLPVDGVVSELFEPHAPSTIADINAIPSEGMIIDIGPETLMQYSAALKECKTALWNGPVGCV